MLPRKFTEGETPLQNGSDKLKVSVYGGDFSRSSGRGLPDTYLHPSQVPPQLKICFHHSQDKVSTSQASIWGPPWPDSRNVPGLICSPSAFIPTPPAFAPKVPSA